MNCCFVEISLSILRCSERVLCRYIFCTRMVRRKETSSPKREKEYRKRSRIEFYQNFFINFEPFYHPLRGADFGLVGSRELHAKYEARGGRRENEEQIWVIGRSETKAEDEGRTHHSSSSSRETLSHTLSLLNGGRFIRMFSFWCFWVKFTDPPDRIWSSLSLVLPLSHLSCKPQAL